MITVKWIEPNRITDLEFKDWSEFVDWSNDQIFFENEQLIIDVKEFKL